MNLFCSSTSLERFLNYDFDAIEINNFKIKNSNSSFTFFKGNTYLFASFAAYGHSLMDVYAQYKILKSKYKDLNVVFYEDSSKGLLFNNNMVTSDFMNFLKYDKKKVIDISKNNYTFEKIVMFFDMNNPFPENFFYSNGIDRSPHYFPFCSCYMGTERCGESKYFKYNYLAIDTLKKDFSIFFNNQKNNKIFISRKRYNDQYKADLIKYSLKDTLSDDDKYWYGRAKIRYFEHEDSVCSLFKENGYTIVYAEDHGLMDQIKIFSSAKEIVSVSGTGLFNSFWCDNNTKVYEIVAVDGFRYHYKEFSEYSGTEYAQVNVTGLNKVDSLEKIKNDIIYKRKFS